MSKTKYLNINSSLSISVPLDQVVFFSAGTIVDVKEYTVKELEEALYAGDLDFDWIQAYNASGSIVDYDYFDQEIVEGEE